MEYELVLSCFPWKLPQTSNEEFTREAFSVSLILCGNDGKFYYWKGKEAAW